MADRLSAVIFDLGGVVLGWDPVLAFEQVLPADQVRDFLTKIDFYAWNRANDGGRAFEVGERELTRQFPDAAEAIAAYRTHFDRALTGMVPGTSAVIAELAAAGVQLSALTNWSAETFPHAVRRFGILKRFSAIVVSGTERLLKPDPALYRVACERSGLDPRHTVFIDDTAANVAAAEELGLTGILFTDATSLRRQLVQLGVLGPRPDLAAPIFHLALRDEWEQARTTGHYPWSTRGVTYEQQGFVHASFASQVAGIRSDTYHDVSDSDLVLLELDPRTIDVPVVVEDLGAGAAYPHLYGALPVSVAIPHRTDMLMS